MITLIPFSAADFDAFISWVNTEELLVTIAGNVFTWPLTAPQLQKYLELENSHSFTVVDAAEHKKIGHAEIVLSGRDMYKIDKLIIGETANRGKGIGQAVINELLLYSFTKLDAEIVELNVFDWNRAGIRCYEKCGFVMNNDKQAVFEVGDKSWIALNMTIDKQSWMSRNTGINQLV